MEVIDLLKLAIGERKAISFEYLAPGKTQGIRYGHPYVIMFHPETGNAMAHIFQTHGVSDTQQKLPNWRLFKLGLIKNLQICEEEPSFSIQASYKPYSPMYSRIIAKI